MSGIKNVTNGLAYHTDDLTLNTESKLFFKEMNYLKDELNMNELSMGMSADYVEATKNSSTFLRIGSKIFGLRS